MFQKNPWPLPPYPTPSTPWFRAAVGRWSPRSRPCWCRRPRGAFLGSARGPSPLVPPDFFARPRHTTLKNPGHRGRGYGRGSGRHKPQQKAREAPRFKYYSLLQLIVETLVYPHTLWPVPPGFRRCIEPWPKVAPKAGRKQKAPPAAATNALTSPSQATRPPPSRPPQHPAKHFAKRTLAPFWLLRNPAVRSKARPPGALPEAQHFVCGRVGHRSRLSRRTASRFPSLGRRVCGSHGSTRLVRWPTRAPPRA